MKRKIVEKAALKAKSEETGIPFSNLLAGYVLEQIMYLISESDFAEFLWLKNDEILGLEQYERQTALSLDFIYLTDAGVIKKGDFVPGQKLSLKMGYIMLAHMLKKEKVPEIKWRAGASWENDMLELQIRGEFQEMTVPLQIHICELGDESAEVLIPVKKEFPLFMQAEKNVPYLKYPAEIVLVEQLFLIIQKMELIPELTPYDKVYQILEQEPVDGRHIGEMLETACNKEEIPLEEERIKEIISYKDYNYMCKRWEKYIRHRKGAKPSWQEVMEKLEAFLPGIWKAICKNEIFFGDWMPGLGRFLD